MSAFCLDLHTSKAAISAPPELDSDCMEHPVDQGNKTPQEKGGFQGHSLLHTGSGGLGMALEEELAMLTGEQDDEEEELPEFETPVIGQNTDLLSLFRQKEKDLVLAAKLGKALLERNQALTKQYEQMNKDLNDKLEVSSFYTHCQILYNHDSVLPDLFFNSVVWPSFLSQEIHVELSSVCNHIQLIRTVLHYCSAIEQMSHCKQFFQTVYNLQLISIQCNNSIMPLS